MGDVFEIVVNNAITFGYNFQWALASYPFAIIMAIVAVIEHQYGRRNGVWLALGAALTEMGTANHRAFWIAALVEAPAGRTYALEYVKAKWLLWFDVQITILGMAMMARPLLLHVFHRWWLVAPMLISLGFFVGAFWWFLRFKSGL